MSETLKVLSQSQSWLWDWGFDIRYFIEWKCNYDIQWVLELCSALPSSRKPFWAERDWPRLGMDCPSHTFEGITLILPFRMVKDWEQQWLKPADCQSYKRHRKAVVEALIHCPESIGHACCPWISDILFHTKKNTISSKCLCFHL